MYKWKKIIAIMLAVLMAVNVVPVDAFATEADDVIFALEEEVDGAEKVEKIEEEKAAVVENENTNVLNQIEVESVENGEEVSLDIEVNNETTNVSDEIAIEKVFLDDVIEITGETITETNEIIEMNSASTDQIVWDGTTATSFGGGTGTEDNPFLISSAQELTYLMKYEEEQGSINKYYELTQDIFLNNQNTKNVWNSIECFRGILNGAGYTIYGLYQNELIKKNIGKIYNLTIENAILNITEDSYRDGSLVDDNCGIIENCYLKGNIEFNCLDTLTDENGDYSIGGIVGINEKKGIINKCYNTAVNVFSTSFGEETSVRLSGIVNENNGTLQYCEFSGEIKNVDLKMIGSLSGIADYNNGNLMYCATNKEAKIIGYTVAGIVRVTREVSNCKNYAQLCGRVVSGIAYETYSKIKDCENSGKLITEYYEDESGDFGFDVAGIVFLAKDSIIDNCINKANINNGNAYISGIAYNCTRSDISNCINMGDLSGKNVAGIVYHLMGDSTVEQCINKGKLYSENLSAGIVFNTDVVGENIFIEKCINEGDIFGEKYGSAAGIVGHISGNAIVENCYNKGSIEVESAQASGIVDWVEEYGNVEIRNCYNSGSINGYGGDAAGIAGKFEAGKIISCYNEGEITTNFSVGIAAGIVSEIDGANAGSIYLNDCYNSGLINGYGSWSRASGIIGVMYSSNKTDVFISNCYNVGSILHHIENDKFIGEIISDASAGNVFLKNIFYIINQNSMVAIEGEENVFTYNCHAVNKNELQKQSTFDSSWDFENVWEMGDENYPYPILREAGIKVEKDQTKYQRYVLRVLDEETKMPIPKARVSIGGTTYVVLKDGTLSIDLCDTDSIYAIIYKNKYETKSGKLKLDSTKVTDVYLKSIAEVNIEYPEIEEEMKNAHSVEFLGKDIKWLDIDYKFKVTPDKEEQGGRQTNIPISIEYDKDTATYKAVFGIKESDDSGTVNTGTYGKMKKLCDGIGTTSTAKKVQDFMSENGWKQAGKMGVDIDTHIMGYIEFFIDDDGNFNAVESGALIGMKGKGDIKYRPAFAFGVAYAKLSLELSAEGQLTMVFENESISFSIALELGQIFGVGIGVGEDNIHIEGGAEGGFEETIKYVPAEDDLSFEALMKGKLYLEGKFFFLEGVKDYNLADIKLWPLKSGKNVTRAGNYSKIFSPVGYDLNSFNPISRDYLSNTYVLRRSSNLEAESVYPEGEPEMVQLDNGTLIATWLTDDGTKSSENRTTLVYSVNEGNGWSMPSAVSNTTRGDFYPMLSKSGNKAYLAWINIDHELGVDFTAEEIAKSTDVFFAEFDNGRFNGNILITEWKNNKLELMPQAVSNNQEKAVVWVENSENDPFLSSGKNAICAKVCKNGIWGEAKCLIENIGCITSLRASYVDDVLNIAYVMDLDGSITTTDDLEVFLYKEGETTRVTSDKKTDGNVRFSGNMLYWSSQGEIMQMENGLLRTICSTGVTEADAFEVHDNGVEKAFTILRADGFKSELYSVKESEGNFENVIPMSDFGKRINDYAAVYRPNGTITAMVFETEVMENPEEDGIYGNTALHMYDDLYATNIVLKDTYYDIENFKSGEKVPVTIGVHNSSSYDLKQIHVTLNQGDTKVYDSIVSCDIKAGESGEITVEFTVIDLNDGNNLSVTIKPVDFDDLYENDNSVQEEVIFGDLALSQMSITLQEDGTALLSGKLENGGYSQVENITLQIMSEISEGDVLFTKTYTAMAAGAEELISWNIPATVLAFDHENDGKHFYVKCTSDSGEIRYDNNSKTLVIFPTKVTGVELVPETMELTVKTQGILNASVVPATALNKNIYYTTDNSKIATVDENGVITATGVGTVNITAITADGGFSKTCTVTVVEAEEGTVVYGLSEAALALEKGAETQLTVVEADGNATTESVNWSSSDNSIATVDDSGKVTAVAKGIATITANIGTLFYDTCIVEVSDKTLQEIIFDTSNLSMKEGETVALKVIYVPSNTTSDKNVEWISSDEAVAIVDSEGNVTAIAGGKAVITAISANDLTTECEVNVENSPRYTVKFDSDLGDDVIEIRNILGGETIELPEQPNKTGYHFNGWYTERNGKGIRFTEHTAIKESLTVYASWTYGQKYEEYTVEDIPVHIYTGSAVKPKPIVLDGGTLLIEGQDYTLTYKNNTKVGTAQVIVNGKGNYTKTMTIKFEIIPKDLADEDVQITCVDKFYNGKKQVSKPTVKWGKKTLKSGTDYTVIYPEDQISSGVVTVTIEGKGNYGGSVETSYRITDKDISKVLMNKIPTQYYTGQMVEPEVILYEDKVAKSAGKSLVLDSDYSIVYENNVDVGKGKIIITGMGQYGGNKTLSFLISKKSITSEDIEVCAPTYEYIQFHEVSYNGSAQKPKLNISDLENVFEPMLEEGKDYKLSYSNTTNAATVDSKRKPTITITGMGNYTGTKKVSFNILPQNIETAEGFEVTVADAKYTGKEVKPKVTVTYAGKTLKSGTDYKVTSYYNNIDLAEKDSANAPYVTIEGIKNFTGTVDVKFRIYELSASGLVVDKISPQIYTPHEVIEPKVFVYASKAMRTEGNALVEGVDYEITSYEANEKAGTGKVTVTGIGQYGGSKTVTFTISKRNLLLDDISVEMLDKQMTYTGSALKPVFRVWDKDIELTEGVDYTVTYSNNKTVSKSAKTVPTITIKGKGNYTGTIKETFEILPKVLLTEGIVVTAKDVLFSQKTANSAKGMTTTVTVMDGSKKLSTSDYKVVEYKNNRTAGDVSDADVPTVVIEGKGNYTGTVEIPFRIFKNNISKAVVAKIPNELYTGKVIEPKPVVTLKVSKTETITLVEGKDYTVSYDKNVKIGKAKVIITGMGEYGGSKSVTFTILPKWLKWFV